MRLLAFSAGVAARGDSSKTFGGLCLTQVEQLAISIGQIPLHLQIPDRGLFEKACGRYAHFLGASPDSLWIQMQTGEARDGNDGAKGHGKFAFDCNGASLLYEGTSARFNGVRHEYALDSLIRILLSVMLVPRRGFLLHAATVLRSGAAYVFTGRSGAGKSTVASLSPAGSVLTDEISLLRAGENGWDAYGTPFWGEFRADGANVHAPVKGVYILVQAPEDRVEVVSPREALRALLPNVLFFSRDRELTDELLKILTGLVTHVPCYRLFFRRQKSFWEAITQ
ncbi:MAG: hypothetical protein WBE20_09905 [Candidatus Acidiferrales bacterium]